MDKTILTEQYGTESIAKLYLESSSGNIEVKTSSRKWTSVVQSFKNVFLPHGYPDSVSDDYMTYQVWDTMQAFCSSITGALAAQAVLKGVGVGDENATVLAATMTWLVKDGTGMMGRIVFTWMQGSYLDCDCKRWRLFADILNDCAICMEILGPAFPAYFSLIVCTAGVCKSIVGVAGGATRAAITQHQARRNNLADVSAKDGSQETLVNLAALLCNLMLVPLVTDNASLIWALFATFTFLHLFANYNAVTSVTMATLNQARLHIIMKEYLKTGNIPGVKTTNRQEPVILKTGWKYTCYLGSSAQYTVKTSRHLSKLKQIYTNANYLLDLDLTTESVKVIFSEHATNADYLRAAMQFELLDFFAITYHGEILEASSDVVIRSLMAAACSKDDVSMLSHSYIWITKHFAGLSDDLKLHGWQLDHMLFHIDEWRAEWRETRLKLL